MRIYAGSYGDCNDAAIVAICAGVAQNPGETRPQLLGRNREVFRSVIDPVLASGFEGIFLIATNPVDIMARIATELSGLPSSRVIGTGTLLDTARLRYLLGDYFGVDPRNIHAYVMGEHGDSEFVPWSQAMIATKPVHIVCDEFRDQYNQQELFKIEEEVRTAAQKIIEAKRATYYGIGTAMTRITRAIFGDENSILTISSYLNGEYGESDVFAGAPAIVNRNGVSHILELSLTPHEISQFHQSCELIRGYYHAMEQET